MCANPESLKDLCLNYLCHNIEKMYKAEETCENDSESECVFINKNVFLPKELSEELLTKLSVYDKLNDEILSLFSNKNVYLRFVFIYNLIKLIFVFALIHLQLLFCSHAKCNLNQYNNNPYLQFTLYASIRNVKTQFHYGFNL